LACVEKRFVYVFGVCSVLTDRCPIAKTEANVRSVRILVSAPEEKNSFT
jgi:hypothetical protein